VVLVADSKQSGSLNPRVRADMVYFEYPNGGAVFATGSISWDSCLSYNDYINNVSRITENVLNRFQSDEPLLETRPEE
jgi:N,N-dimethylformamidase